MKTFWAVTYTPSGAYPINIDFGEFQRSFDSLFEAQEFYDSLQMKSIYKSLSPSERDKVPKETPYCLSKKIEKYFPVFNKEDLKPKMRAPLESWIIPDVAYKMQGTTCRTAFCYTSKTLKQVWMAMKFKSTLSGTIYAVYSQKHSFFSVC